MNKKYLYPIVLVVGLLVIISALVFATLSKDKESDVDEHFHIHAGFQIHQNGKLRNLAQWKFMYTKVCSANENEERSPAEKQLEKAHLHDLNGDVVHVHMQGATWKDLLVNLNIKTKGRNIVGYIEGEVVEDILNREIQDHERVLIAINPGRFLNYAKFYEQVPAVEKINEVEGKSESCGS